MSTAFTSNGSERDRARSVVVRNATVIDGTGAPGHLADIVVVDGVIGAIEPAGSVPPSADAELIDASGLVVAPGFIDAHSHADNAPLLDADDLTKISQGVTTEVVGNCGFSLAPVAADREAEFLGGVAQTFPFEYSGWHSIRDWFDLIDRRGTVVNVCPLIGHGTLRLAVIGSAAVRASDEHLAAMGRLLQEATDAGAFGLSSGLITPPGSFSTTDELIALASFLPADRVYATHMRDESFRLAESIDEALAVGRESGARVHISHLKSAGKPNWGGVGRAIDMLDAARAAGMRVTQDVYPYDAAATSLGACLPPWVHDGGTEAALRVLADEASVRRIRDEVDGGPADTWENIVAGAGYDGIVVADSLSHRWDGMTLTRIAELLGIAPFDALVLVLREDRFDARMIVFDMSEADIEAALASPFTAIGSDGAAPGGGGLRHPRLFGTFPRVLGSYVRERGVLSLPEAVRRMTSLPADIFGIPDRGRIAVGAVADLVAFDPATIGHPGSYSTPALPPTGIAWVMQAGDRVMVDGQWAGRRRGRRLTPRPTPSDRRAHR